MTINMYVYMYMDLASSMYMNIVANKKELGSSMYMTTSSDACACEIINVLATHKFPWNRTEEQIIFI